MEAGYAGALAVLTDRTVEIRHEDATALGSDRGPPHERYQIGITPGVAMTLRLDDADASALRDQAAREGRTMNDLVRQAVRDYLERAGRRAGIDAVLDRELPRYGDALRRLGE